ncbi:hypothetical protein [Streptomyces sp. NPDC059639]|uniref:hypothetical protein n=1 Tax=Streptomyces sp. NPDC059639 TaxID=3346891 RepID=UPI00367A086B
MESMQWEIFDYGVDLEAHEEDVRIPLVQALLSATRELQREFAAAEGWDVVERGPYFGDLEHLLECELDVSR